MKDLRQGRDWLYVDPSDLKHIQVVDPLLYDKSKAEVIEWLKSQPEDVLIRTCGKNINASELLAEVEAATIIGKAFVIEVVAPNSLP